jgi:6-phosphogluconolactonase
MIGELRVFDDAAALAKGMADWLLDRALRHEATLRICLCGGNTPKPAYELLGRDPILSRFPWPRVHWFFGDERFVPPGDPASNFGMVRAAFLTAAPVPPPNVHPILTERMTAREAAEAYEAVLKSEYGAPVLSPGRNLFDVTLLGIGEDGHTASLIPGEPVLQERARWVAEVPSGREQPRITLTYPALESSALVVFLVSGPAKREALRRVRAGDTGIPAGALRPHGQVLFFADRAAAE